MLNKGNDLFLVNRPSDLVRRKAKTLLKNKIIIGHNIGCDFKKLHFSRMTYICTDGLGTIYHSRKKHDPEEDALESLRIAVRKL